LLKQGNSRRRLAAAAIVLGVAACVSLSSPGDGGGPVPVVRGVYKSGATQIVRLLLDPAKDSNAIGGTGDWAVFAEGEGKPLTQFRSGQTLAMVRNLFLGCSVTNGLCTDTVVMLGTVNVTNRKTPLVVRPLDPSSFVTWNGKRYRGEIVIGDTTVVNRLPMDSYLRGVVPLEIGNRTADEFAAVQAQAVAARTYAYKHLNNARSFDMYSTVQDQVYGGVDAEKPQSDSAIATTADIVVLYNGQPISTPYSSTCGGSTAAVTEVWYNQSDEPYLRPVSDRIPGSDHFY